PHEGPEHRLAGAEPEQRQLVPVASPSNGAMNGIDVLPGRQNPARTNQPLNLKVPRVERGEENDAEAAQPDPSRAKKRRCHRRREPSLQNGRLHRFGCEFFEHGVAVWLCGKLTDQDILKLNTSPEATRKVAGGPSEASDHRKTTDVIFRLRQ